MNLTSGYTHLPVMAGITGPVLVAAGGLVVVLAILLVFVMVLRSNGEARKTSNGIGYDAHQGPYGQSRAPVSQPNRMRPAPWNDEYNGQRDPAGRPNYGGPTSGGDWPAYGSPNGPAAANTGRGGAQAGWGSPSGGGWGEQPASSPQWGGQMDAPNQAPQPAPQWGGQPAAQGPAQGGWDAPRNDRNDWNQQPDPQQGWNAPPTTPRGWEQPAPQPAPQPSAQWGGAPANQPASGRQDWNNAPVPAPAAPPYGRQDYSNGGGYPEDQRTFVARPQSAQGEAKLVISEGKEPGRNYDIRKERITIGRSRDSDIFLEDLAVSRTHTSINRMPDGSYLLRDENSANGTVVNGQRVNEHPLEDGDKVQVGQTLLVFVYR